LVKDIDDILSTFQFKFRKTHIWHIVSWWESTCYTFWTAIVKKRNQGNDAHGQHAMTQWYENTKYLWTQVETHDMNGPIEGVGFPRLNSRDQTQVRGPIRLLPIWFGMIIWFMVQSLFRWTLVVWMILYYFFVFSCYLYEKGKSYLFYKKRVPPLG